MLLLPGDDAFTELLGQAQSEAFHLEVRDTYEQPDESEELRRFLSDGTIDVEAFTSWSDLVQRTRARGVAVTRARVVTEPLTDYSRFALAVAKAMNAPAGEDVRYLPRHTVDADDITQDDWWMVDDGKVAFNLVGASGAGAGVSVTTDPRILEYCRSVKRLVWQRAVPLTEYGA